MKSPGYSSTVILTLFICGAELALSHVSSDFCVVRESEFYIDGGEAQLLISVDGVEEKRTVIVTEGIPAGRSVRVSYF